MNSEFTFFCGSASALCKDDDISVKIFVEQQQQLSQLQVWEECQVENEKIRCDIVLEYTYHTHMSSVCFFMT